MARWLYVALTVLFISVCGCGGGSSSSHNVSLSSIRIAPASTTIAAGTTTQFRANGTYSDGSVADITASVTWSSSNTTVAAVSNAAGTKGLATAVAVGSSTIKATLQGVSGSATLNSAAIQAITVTPANAVPIAGTTQQYRATATFAGGSQDLSNQVIWTSTNPTVATISNTSGSRGVLTARTAGTAGVKATFGSVVSTAAPVTVVTLDTITVTPNPVSVPIGSSQQFTALGNLSNNEVRDVSSLVTWRSGNPAMATINASGSATTVGIGTTTVSASFPGSQTGSATITVLAPESITVTPRNVTAVAGSTQQFKAIGTFAGGTTRDLTNFVTWTSSVPTVATISNASGSKGLLTAAASVTSGTPTTIVTATLGVSDSTTVIVKNLKSLVITPSTTSIAVGSTRQLAAIATFTDNTSQDVSNSVTWSSSAPSIASVSDVVGSKGLVSGNVIGNATITARLGNVQSATSAVSVGSGTPVTTTRKAFVSNFGSNTVSVIDTDTNELVNDPAHNPIPVGIGPQGIAINTLANRAYVANSGNGTVSVIDVANNVVVDTINTGGIPWNVAVNASGNRLYVTNRQLNSVTVIDTTTDTIIKSIPLSGGDPTGIAVNPALNRAYVTNFSANTVSVIDTTTNTEIEVVVPRQGPFDVAVEGGSNTFWVVNSLAPVVSVFDRNDLLVKEVPVLNGGQVIAINPLTRRAYVTLRDSNSVAVIDTSTNTFLNFIGTGIAPKGVAVKPSANLLYVANNGSNDIWVFDTTTFNIVKQITGFIGPTYIAVMP